MARKEITITIDGSNRDSGKTFFLREMPATRAERWATRALLALLRSGLDIPDDIASAGLAGVAAMGIKAFAGLRYEDAEPLLAEMLTCVQFLPDPSRPVVKRALIDDDIEEISTLLRVREEIITLHTGFSFAGLRSRLTTPAATADNTQSIATSAAQ